MPIFFRLIRLPNLLIVALTQVLLGRILYAHLEGRSLSDVDFWWLIWTTMIIAASGYVINDIYDYEIDLVNKPAKVIVGKRISARKSWQIYGGIVLLGTLVAIYLAYQIQDFKQLLIYPSAILMLWAYAKKYKKSFVIGNMVVAAYCALVPGILLYAERVPFTALAGKSDTHLIWNVFGGYALMAFLTTVWRELIKDMEDLTGDKVYGSQSLPVKYGLPLARKIAMILGLIVLGFSVYYWVYLVGHHYWLEAGYLLILISLVIYTIVLPQKSTEVQVLHRVSQQIKWIMVLGLGYLFFLV